MFVALLALQVLTATPAVNPFAVFEPSVTITADDRRRLDRGEPLARVLPAGEHEVAVFAAVRVDVDGDRLVSWMRRVEELKKSPYVLAIRRFSQPPVVEDLAGLALDDEELTDMLACRPAKCGLKLSSAEMARLQRAAADAGRDWKPAVQEAFRLLVLQRVQAYLAGGRCALLPYEDDDGQTWPATSFSRVLGRSVFLTEHLPRFAEHLSRYPQTPTPEVESFVYWSRERVAGRAIVSATQVDILRGTGSGQSDTIVAGSEIFATHYLNASLGVTALVRGEPGGHNYLVYMNRSEVDVLGGVFGGVVRWVMERRLKTEAAGVLQGLRRRLEGGEPPSRRSDGMKPNPQ
ncbi:MAG: hypothetical protein ACM3SQ_17790 [Betaproteobacteria bacterium]